jgi:chemotaxis protein methyltransferase CheR
MVKINNTEYTLMKAYIKEQCGIFLEEGKEYLIESRLTDLVIEQGCVSFNQLHDMARSDTTGKLKDRIVDSMTTNETLWFRDDTTWNYLREVAVPRLIEKARQGRRVRIWSAAASTGQEAYSLKILIHEAAEKLGQPSLSNKIDILGTDISASALFLAISGRYGQMAINRGLSATQIDKYFNQKGSVWEISPELKKGVSFKQFNLLNDFYALGSFDLVLCRYVLIYFDEEFKRSLYAKIAEVMNPGAVLLIGATESLRGLTDRFKISYYKTAVFNEKL